MASEREEVLITLEDKPPTKRKKKSNLSSYFSVNTSIAKEVKNHTHAKRGAHLRISVWHLLMNSKKNY